MADKDSGDKQPWAVPVLVAVVGAMSAVAVAWVNKPQQPVAQTASSPQAVSPSPTSQLSSSPSTPTSSNEQKYDLTGVWKSENHASGRAAVYVRQIDSTVWWYGEGSGWSAVLKGTLSGDQISAEFADVPVSGKPNRYSGKVAIYILSPVRMRVVHPGSIEFDLSRQFDDNRK